jgi:hypothetical protein
MFDIRPETVAIAIPILFVLGLFAAIIASIVINGRRKELEHKERLIAMEKGLPIPESPPVARTPRYLVLRNWGLVVLCFGVSLVIAISVAEGVREGVWGLLPLSIGAGLLIAAQLEKSDMH